jgi:hypothetical protein
MCKEERGSIRNNKKCSANVKECTTREIEGQMNETSEHKVGEG